MNKYDKPVDSIIEESNAKLVVVKDSGRDCDKCFFYETKVCDMIPCISDLRSDNQDVVFKKVD